MPSILYGVTVSCDRDPARRAFEIRNPVGSGKTVHLQRISVTSPTGVGIGLTVSKFTSLATHNGTGETQVPIPPAPPKPTPTTECWQDDTGSDITWPDPPSSSLSKTVSSSAHWNVVTTPGYALALSAGQSLAIELTDNASGALTLGLTVIEQT